MNFERNKTEIALMETRLALRMVLQIFKKTEKTPVQQKHYDNAKEMLKKHFDVREILREQ